jgi:DNA-binding transcriptional LysR family regulator
MDARQLELFLAVIESPTMTKAAERVHLSTAAVSVQLRALADELKTDLFVRSGKRLIPTAAAHRLEVQARRVVNEIRSIRESFANNDASRDARPFHFATGATTLIYRLAEPLRSLRSTFPDLDLHVHVLATEEMVAGLLSGQFDLCLISLPYSHPQLRIVPMFEEELLLLRPSPKRINGSQISAVRAADLDGAPAVLYPPQSNMRTIIDGFFQELHVVPRVIMEASDTEVIKCMVEAGFGFSVLPEYALINARGFFHTLRVAGHRLLRNQALATTNTAHARPLTGAVITFLQEVLGQPERAVAASRELTGSHRSPEIPHRRPARDRSRN